MNFISSIVSLQEITGFSGDTLAIIFGFVFFVFITCNIAWFAFWLKVFEHFLSDWLPAALDKLSFWLDRQEEKRQKKPRQL